MNDQNERSISAPQGVAREGASPIRRAYQGVAEDLAALIGARYEVGEKLPAERELTKRYGVSRPTVREALLALSIRGMVEIRGKGGVYVARREALPQTQSDVGVGPFEVLEARLLIEPELAAMAAAKSTPALVAELESGIAAMRAAHARDREGIEGDLRFHVALASATGNSVLAAVCDQLWRAQLDSPIWDRIHGRMELKRYRRVWEQDHEAIAESVKLASPIQARIAMIRHLENIRSALLNNSRSTEC